MVGLSLRIVVACLVMASSAAAMSGDRFTAERLVGMEAFGDLRVSDDGRWVVVERQGAYDHAATYSYGPLTGAILTDLLVFDTTGRSPDRIVGAEDLDGYEAGPISPDGRRMIVYRLTAQDRTLGVMTLETGRVKWFDLSPQLAVAGRTVAWTGNHSLFVIQTPSNTLPLYYRLFRETQERVSDRWREVQSGRLPTSTYVISGSGRDGRSQVPPARLVRLDIETGAVRTLLSGEVSDFEPSPDGRFLAVLLNGEDVQTGPEAVVTIGTPTRRRRLELVDLSTGQIRDPAPDLDVLSYLMAWSADGNRLLAYGRRGDAEWGEGRFAVIGVEGTMRLLETGAAASLDQADPGAFVARGGWLGDDPVMLLADGDGPPSWRRLERDGTLVRLRGDAAGLLGFDAAGTWMSEPGGITNLGLGRARSGRWISRSTAVDGGERSLFNPVDHELALAAVLTPEGCLTRVAAQKTSSFCPAPVEVGQTLVLSSADARTAVFSGQDAAGVSRVSIALAAGERRTLVTVNPDFASLEWGAIREVRPPAEDQGASPSWLLVPPGPPPAEGWPLVVRLYPGSTYPLAPSLMRPGGLMTQLNPQVLAGAGYAVLIPSLPDSGGRSGGLAGLAARLSTIVDQAVATGDLDPGRVALMGHSYGGHAALLAATETDRFQAVVASAGLADMATSLRDTVHASANPADGVWINGAAGWLEAGQGGMGGLPWGDPAAYVAASPLYAADRIRTPVLLIHGDLDPVSADAMFGALYRLNREGALLTYWGEGHNLASPANIIDLHRRTIQFLDDHLRPRPRE